jgi:predicted esterase YcpF (UPF0227 family)
MRPLLIYIHGYLSSPQSQKALLTQQFLDDQAFAVDYLAPALPNYPAEAYRQLHQLIDEQSQLRQITLIGSSLGGFMATILSQTFDLRAVLVNPSVKPYQHADHFLGDNINPYSQEQFFLHEGHIDELRQLDLSVLDKKDLLMVMLQTGDEVLDYQQAVDYYQGCTQIVEQGGDHRFQNFDRHLSEIVKFLELT